VRDALKRSLPGRIVGLSVDSRGAAGLSAGAADPRAAYPPREGHLQHLHRAGAAGGDRLDVCGLSRAGGLPHRPPVHRRAAVLAAGLRKLGFALASEAFFDTVAVTSVTSRCDRRARARREDQSADRRRHARHRAGRDHHVTTSRRCGAPSAANLLMRTLKTSDARGVPAALTRNERVPDPSGVPRAPLRDRIVALHAQAQ
jgi:hypothetical protein